MVVPWDLLVLLCCAIEVIVVRWLIHRAFHRGYDEAKAIYQLPTQRQQEIDDFWDRQRALAGEPKKA